jgi:hypothetical protein
MQLSEQPPLSKSYFEKYRTIIVVLVLVIVVLGVLFIPYIPITKEKTRTVTLQYNSQLYNNSPLRSYVNVTNEDSISGDFSVTMNYWYTPLTGQEQLENTSSQSLFIKARATQTFYVPSGWIDFDFSLITYSVSAPTKQQSYNVTNTQYKSIFDLIRGS